MFNCPILVSGASGMYCGMANPGKSPAQQGQTKPKSNPTPKPTPALRSADDEDNGPFSNLVAALGKDKFEKSYKKLIMESFETEQELLDYAMAYIANQQINELKTALVDDLGLSKVQAGTLAGVLFGMKG